MITYKCRALVELAESEPEHPAGSTCRMVVEAEHPDTHQLKLLSSLVTFGYEPAPGDGSEQIVKIAVVDHEAPEYLQTGQHFKLWREGEIGHGQVSRRVFF